MIVQPHPDTSILQVGIRDIAIGADLKNDIVPANVIDCDGR
jgi:hypothetical protein